MKFQYKCFLQNTFSKLNAGVYLNYIFQKYVTKKIPIKPKDFLKRYESKVSNHLKTYKKYSQVSITNSVYYEFGAGWDLMTALCFSCKGIKHLYCIDIKKLIFPELINNTINLITNNKDLFAVDLKNVPVVNKKNINTVLKNVFNIEYKAPCDAKNTGLDNESVDFIVSNVTFEHIPKESMSDILNECYRILKIGGIMSISIDYQDHWSYFDKSITVYNFLQYSKEEWQKYNPSLHYQNRLRHSEYINFIEKSNFKTLDVRQIKPNEENFKKLEMLNIHNDFKIKYSLDDISILGSHIVLTK